MSSQGSRSPSSSRGKERSPSPKRDSKPFKLFVTNLDANGDTRKLEDQLRTEFTKYGQVASIVVKRSHNNQYCFAFIDYKEGEDATQAMEKLNGVSVGGKNMKVELQDNARRRKTTSGGECYKCGKPGHFARECRSQRQDERRGRSRSKDRKKKKSHRHRSESSQSAHAKKKDKKKHKSHKKHKKSKKKHYSSDSDSSD